MITTVIIHRHTCSCCGYTWETYGCECNPTICPVCCKSQWEPWNPRRPWERDPWTGEKPFDAVFSKKVISI